MTGSISSFFVPTYNSNLPELSTGVFPASFKNWNSVEERKINCSGLHIVPIIFMVFVSSWDMFLICKSKKINLWSTFHAIVKIYYITLLSVGKYHDQKQHRIGEAFGPPNNIQSWRKLRAGIQVEAEMEKWYWLACAPWLAEPTSL